MAKSHLRSKQANTRSKKFKTDIKDSKQQFILDNKKRKKPSIKKQNNGKLDIR
jgi:hypothetical protein